MKIKVLEKIPGSMPEIFKIGDWIDLVLAEDVELKAPEAHKLRIRNKNKKEVAEERVRDVTFDSAIASLGICMELPDGFEAVIAPRSSLFKTFGVTVPNSIGVIDNLYKGDNDVWKLPLLAFRKTVIPKGTRIAQFRIQLSQKASWRQKLKWLFSSSIRVQKVDSLENPSRGGFGSTGIKLL